MSKNCIIGARGFIGSALAKRLGDYTTYPTKDTEIIYYFGSKTHMAFEENVDYHLNNVIQDFLYLLPYCKQNNIKFVYASSALVYEKNIAFSKCKKILEILSSIYPNTIGLRIFPVYGPQENTTVISKWCREIKDDIRPRIYSDGNQSRDFIFIDDVIDQILFYSKQESGIYDVGTGELKSFNNIIDLINEYYGKNIEPEYIESPEGYSQKGVRANTNLQVNTSLKEAVEKICIQLS